jgi:hypothetical protein
MGFLRKRRLEGPPAQQTLEVTLVTGDESLDVVGESYRQDALWLIVGGNTTEHVRHDVVAILTPETKNPKDANAISVWVDGSLVGFLSREDAERYRPGLIALCQRHRRPVALRGHIIGGGLREDGQIGYLGVFLDHDPAEFGLVSTHDQTDTHVRTGRHEADASGVGLENLPADDVRAIKAIRKLLNQEREPVARHFAYAELEHRLYHCRDVFESALAEFDETCETHHSELPVIRPALIAEFGGIPLLEVYRQICIRKQKAHDWDAVISWADRGIAAYASDALNPESVSDLCRRRESAAAKLNPEPRSPRVSRAATHGETEIEELTCLRCSSTFARAVTRGRKPSLCPTCRELA